MAEDRKSRVFRQPAFIDFYFKLVVAFCFTLASVSINPAAQTVIENEGGDVVSLTMDIQDHDGSPK